MPILCVSRVLSGSRTVRTNRSHRPNHLLSRRQCAGRTRSRQQPTPPPHPPRKSAQTYQSSHLGRPQVHDRPVQVAVHVGGVAEHRRRGGNAQRKVGREGERHDAGAPRHRARRHAGAGAGGGGARSKVNPTRQGAEGSGAPTPRRLSNNQAKAAADGGHGRGPEEGSPTAGAARAHRRTRGGALPKTKSMTGDDQAGVQVPRTSSRSSGCFHRRLGEVTAATRGTDGRPQRGAASSTPSGRGGRAVHPPDAGRSTTDSEPNRRARRRHGAARAHAARVGAGWRETGRRREGGAAATPTARVTLNRCTATVSARLSPATIAGRHAAQRGQPQRCEYKRLANREDKYIN